MSSREFTARFQSPVAVVMKQFVLQKQACGYKYGEAARVLAQFDRFLCDEALSQCELPRSISPLVGLHLLYASHRTTAIASSVRLAAPRAFGNMKLRDFRWRIVMRRLTTLLAAGFAGSLLAYPLAGVARVDVDVTIAPPAAVVEDVPVRPGYIYAPGYWDWDADHHRHVWKKGEYMKERHGERYVPYAWSEHNGHYQLNPGHWEHSDHGS